MLPPLFHLNTGAHHDTATTPNDRGHEAQEPLHQDHQHTLRLARLQLRHSLRPVARERAVFGRDDVRAYLLFLIQEKKVSWSVYNQTRCALRFCYEVTLGRNDVLERIPFPKQPKRLPVVLSPDEVARFFTGLVDVKHRAILMTAYAAGLRVSEVVALRIDDIDSRRMVLRVRQGKGRKDRDVMLSPRLLTLLREYWKLERPTDWLSSRATSPATPSPARPCTFLRSVSEPRRMPALGKHVTVHTLRHSFATHLLEAGTDIRTIQILLGHRKLGNHRHLYTRLTRHRVEATQSPLDRIQPLPGEARP